MAEPRVTIKVAYRSLKINFLTLKKCILREIDNTGVFYGDWFIQSIHIGIPIQNLDNVFKFYCNTHLPTGLWTSIHFILKKPPHRKIILKSEYLRYSIFTSTSWQVSLEQTQTITLPKLIITLSSANQCNFCFKILLQWGYQS